MPGPSGPATLTVGVLRETATGERRVALDPETSSRLVTAGRPVLDEAGAGVRASFPNEAYRHAGARVVPRAEVVSGSDVLAVVRAPDDALVAGLHTDQLLIGLLEPLQRAGTVRDLASRGVTAAAFELLPRTLSRAQDMDAVSSQASAAGYRAGVLAAASFQRYFPMMITASGTAAPARVIVIGAGVAGLQAIATVRRLGAVVTGYDVRPASRGEVESLGAAFLTSSVAEGAGSGGYARAMTAAETVTQQDELAHHLVGFDVVITTAKVPGRTPPLLVTAGTLAAMRPGSVCIDLASSAGQRGNVAGSVEGEPTVTDGGVVVVGGGNLASDLATSASHMYARNVLALITSLAPDGAVTVDPDDEVHAAVVVCHGGALTHQPVPTPSPTPSGVA